MELGPQFHELNSLGRSEAVGLSAGRGPHEPLPQRNPSAYNTYPARAMSFFHGSDTRFRQGDIIDRSSHPTGVFASVDDPEWAGAHGKHVYLVSPLGDVHQTWGNNVVSGHGWRVSRRVGSGSRSLLTRTDDVRSREQTWVGRDK